MKIIVNGIEKNWPLIGISYRELLSLVGEDPNRVLSVTYRAPKSGDIRREGTLSPGSGTIHCEEGMVFNIADTGNA
jgi:hypothetical protein